jgi:hypothetical protein
MNISNRAVLAFALALGLSGASWAAMPSTGLGQAWPSAADVSLNPHYHVYLFARDGIRYIQVNDLGGTVRAAVATANETILVLPIGVDAAHVNTATTSSSAAETLYQDPTVSVSATPQSNGSVQIFATLHAHANNCSDPGECSNLASPPQ